MNVKASFKKYGWIIFAVIIIGLIFFVAWRFGKKTNDDELSLTDYQQIIAERDYYKLKLDTCENDIPRPLTTEERLAAAEAEIARLKNRPVTVAAPTKNTTVKSDVGETKFEAVTFSAPVVKVSSSITQSSNNAADTNVQYKAVFKGDIGATITPKLNPIYYIKGNVSIKSAPYWCGDSNKKMSYDQENGYWFYIDYGRILPDQELTDPNFYLLWNILIGTVNWSGGSYKAWMPHENIKPLLNSIRGFEYGFITNDDLDQMSRKDSRVWSQSNPTGIYQPIKEAVRERTDPNFWHGWNYRVKVNFTRIVN